VGIAAGNDAASLVSAASLRPGWIWHEDSPNHMPWSAPVMHNGSLVVVQAVAGSSRVAHP